MNSFKMRGQFYKDACSQYDSPVSHSHKEPGIFLKWAVKCLNALFIPKTSCPINMCLFGQLRKSRGTIGF
jgi:hypothetical protein